MSVLHLSHNHLISNGSYRTCYRHPEDHQKVLKIDHPDNNATIREVKYFKKIYSIRGEHSFKAISSCYGLAETNLGKAGVFERITNYDGSTSNNLFNIMHSQEYDNNKNAIDKAFASFKNDFILDAVVSRDIRPWNICVQKNCDTYKMYLIDGVGHRYFLPICDIFKFYARIVIRKHLKRFHFETIETLKKAWTDLPYKVNI